MAGVFTYPPFELNAFDATGPGLAVKPEILETQEVNVEKESENRISFKAMFLAEDASDEAGRGRRRRC